MNARLHSLARRARPAAARCLALALGLWSAHASRAAEVVPVRFIDGLPVVEVQLGAVRADFLLDTGGQLGITVPQPLVSSVTGVTLGTEQRKMGDAAGNVFTVQSLVAATVRLGAAELGPVDGLVQYRWGLQVGAGEAPAVTNKGAIGLGALASRNLLLDLGAGRLVLFDKGEPGPPAATAWAAVPFTYDRAGVVIQIATGGGTASMSLDTAATASMLRKDAKLFESVPSPCRTKPANASFCGVKRLGDLQAGQARLGTLAVAVVQMGGVPFDGLLGIDFFLAHQVYLDFDAKMLYIQDAKPRIAAR